MCLLEYACQCLVFKSMQSFKTSKISWRDGSTVKTLAPLREGQAQFPAPKQWLTTIWNSSSRVFSALSCSLWAPGTHMI